MAYEISFTPNADEQIRAAFAWWLENRPAALDLLERELTRALGRITEYPNIGAKANNWRLAGVRGILLPRTRFQVVYRVRPNSSIIDVLSLWHAARGAQP